MERLDIFERILSFMRDGSIRARLRRLSRLIGDIPMSREVKRKVLEMRDGPVKVVTDSVIDSKTCRLKFEKFPDICSVSFVKQLSIKSYSILQNMSRFEKRFGDLEKLPQGRVVFDAYRLLFEEANDIYLAFGLSVTILERTLFELHYEAFQSSKVSGVTLLRDLLSSSKNFGNLIPRQIIPFFRTLFLPEGLNLRNLYWHGFMTPAATSRNYTALLIHILASLAPNKKLERIKTWRHDLNTQNQRLESVDSVGSFSLNTLRSLFISSDFVSHETWFLNAFAYLLNDESSSNVIKHTSREACFLITILPLYEQSLRKLFVVSNVGTILSCFAMACESEYFSTLDGYGQRHVHVRQYCAAQRYQQRRHNKQQQKQNSL